MAVVNVEEALLSTTEVTWSDSPVELWWSGNDIPVGYFMSAVCGFITTSDRMFVCVDVIKRGWDLPGGHVEEGESLESCFFRKVEEETGLPQEVLQGVQLHNLGWFKIVNERTIMPVVHAPLLMHSEELRHLRSNVQDEIRNVQLFPLSTDGFVDKVWFPYLRTLR